MNVIFIGYGFPPLQASGSLRSGAFADALPQYGVFPCIFSGAPADQVSDGAVVETQWEDNPEWVAVNRIQWGLNSARTSWIRLWGRLPLTNSLCARIRRRRVVNTVVGEIGSAISCSPRAIYCSIAPPECLMVGLQLKKQLGLPLVADLRDPWSYAPSIPYRHYFDFLIERGLERRILHQCDRVIVPAQASADLLHRHLKVPRDLIKIIPNGYNSSDFCASGNQDHNQKFDTSKFNIVYSGEYSSISSPTWSLKRLSQQLLAKIGFLYEPLSCDRTARSLKWFLRAVELVVQEDPAAADQLRLHVFGGKPGQKDDVASQFRHLECLNIHPRVPAQVAASRCQDADLLLLNQNHYTLNGKDCCVAIPAKLYTYLRARRRIMACVQPSEIRDLVKTAAVGVSVDPHDVQRIKAALQLELKQWRESGGAVPVTAKIDVAQFDRRRLTEQLADVLKEVAAGDENV